MPVGRSRTRKYGYQEEALRVLGTLGANDPPQERPSGGSQAPESQNLDLVMQLSLVGVGRKGEQIV